MIPAVDQKLLDFHQGDIDFSKYEGYSGSFIRYLAWVSFPLDLCAS